MTIANFSTNLRNRENVRFGKIIPIYKFILDGKETTNYDDKLSLAFDLGKVLQHDGEHQNGWLIRRQIKKMTGDYTSPEPGQTAESRVYVSPKIAYLATGKDADTFKYITYGRNEYNWPVIDQKIQEEEANNPGAQIEGNKSLVLHGTSVPIPNGKDFVKTPQGTSKN